MYQDSVAALEIDSEGKLHVLPTKQEFPFVYREALEVSWNEYKRSLYSPTPREWTYSRWLEQIFAAATAQGVRLAIDQDTQWVNIPATIKADLLRAAAHVA